MKKSIASNATIAGIVENLNDPTEYVRRVLGNMGVCRNKFGTALVRIGTTGEGKAPNYRIEPTNKDLKEFVDNWDAHYVAYHGRSHKKLDWEFGDIKDEHWSSAKMNFEEIQMLLNSLRKFRQ